MGGPRKLLGGAKKEKYFHVRLNDDEAGALVALAKEHGCARSVIVVALIRAAIGETPGPLALFTTKLQELVFQTRKIGLNINQIAHAANMKNRTVVVDQTTLKELKTHLDDIVDWLEFTRSMNRGRFVKPGR